MVIWLLLTRRCPSLRHVKHKHTLGVLQHFVTSAPDRDNAVDHKASDPGSAFTDKLQRKTEDELVRLMGQRGGRGQPDYQNIERTSKVCLTSDKDCR